MLFWLHEPFLLYLHMEIREMQIVYLFRQKGTNHVKIGMTSSSDCKSRFQAFCTYSPTGGEIVGVIECINARRLEQEIHKMYSSKRMNGEFFLLSQDECDSILIANKNKMVIRALSKIRAWISDDENKAMEIIDYINKKSEKKIKTDTIIDFINKYYEKSEDNSQNITSTDICKHIEDVKGLKCSPVLVGMKMSSFFQKRRVKRNGEVIQSYYIKRRGQP